VSVRASWNAGFSDLDGAVNVHHDVLQAVNATNTPWENTRIQAECVFVQSSASLYDDLQQTADQVRTST